jgi:tRNA (guanine-N7-)-methyltransferase
MSETIRYRLEDLDWPAPWPKLFGRRAELLVEIGFGSGEYLIHLAQRRPEANVLGVEISLPSLQRAVKKIGREGLTNVRVVQSSAESALWLLCAPASLCEVIINFPDPWPKATHHGRRLINDNFLYLLATRMKTGALLKIATDHVEYAAVIAGALSRSPHFQNQLPAPYATKDTERITTKYERLAKEAERACHYFRWRRNELPALNHFPLPQELPMPHVILKTPSDLDEIGRRFEPIYVEADDIQLKFIECYRSLRDGKLLVETLVMEGPLRQRVCLELRPRVAPDKSGREIMIGLHEVGFPRPTRGIHVAIEQLMTWLQEIAPETEIVHSNLAPGGPPD